MRLGLIARCDDRGIGNETWEYHRHLNPARTLVVKMNDRAWPEHPERFHGPGTRIVDSDMRTRQLPEREVRRFLDGLDVVFSVETMYDWRICDWAREMGVRTIVTVNPELFMHHHEPHIPAPDQWWYPTPWLIDRSELPIGPIVPVPCDPRNITLGDPASDTLNILHIAGFAAVGDRNGTIEFIESLQYIRQRVYVTIVGQQGSFPKQLRAPKNVTIDAIPSGFADRWRMYNSQHLVVLPRKYGGRSLPVVEALSCGIPVLMPDCSPNGIWPGPRVKARKGRLQRTKFGPIETSVVAPMDLAREIDRLARDRSALEVFMLEARAFAQENSWDKLRPLYDQAMKAVL